MTETAHGAATAIGPGAGPAGGTETGGAGLFGVRAAQALTVLGIEAGQQLRGLGAAGLALLVVLPSVPWAIFWAVRAAFGHGPDLAATTSRFAFTFQGFVLPLVLFFACVVVFTSAVRRDVRQRTFHHYLLCPVRREVLLAGRFAAGVLVAFAFLAAGTVVAFALAYLQLLGSEHRFAVQAFFTAGPGFGHLTAYLAVALLGCVGYGAVFTALGLHVKNPIVPVIAVAGWEALTPFLPPGLKAITIYHYLRGLCPMPIDEGPFAILAEPPSPWTAVPGLVIVAAVLLALAARKLRRIEIDYGDE